jgi:hypothetical protein
MLRQLAIRNTSDITTAEAVEATIDRPKLRSISIERDKSAVDRFNGIAFSPMVPRWIAYFKLAGDPSEYSLAVISASSQRHACSLALILLRDRGVDVAKA